MIVELSLGDCIERMRELPDASVHAVVTDPPYGLEFMGKAWDSHRDPRSFQDWTEAWATEALRVLKPGGHLLAFGGTRTFHRLAAGLEDAGFEIRDCIAWMYGSGFPKSLDVSKAIDRSHGVEREDKFEGSFERFAGPTGNRRCDDCGKWLVSGNPCRCPRPQDRAVTDDGARWDGWGTALKPAFEPVVVARKPLDGTVAANVLAHGMGAMNIDGCRVVFADEGDKAAAAAAMRASSDQNAGRNAYGRFENGPASIAPYLDRMDKGRWPANVILDEEAAAMLDEQTGVLVSGTESDRGHVRNADVNAARNAYGGFQGQQVTGVLYGDSGGASRFFYCAKTSRSERNAGLDDFAKKPMLWSSGEQSPGTFQAEGTERAARNPHPTVKPISLMRWLIRLVTPPGGTVLDPFLGSGSTGCAAALEPCVGKFIGIEQDADYLAISQARIDFWIEHGEAALDVVRARERAADIEAAGQLTLDGGMDG